MFAEIKHLWNNYKNYTPYCIILILLGFIFIPVLILVLIMVDSYITMYDFNLFGLFIFSFIVAIIITSIFSRTINKKIGDKGKSCIDKIATCQKIENHANEGDEYSAVLIANNLSQKENNLTNACGAVSLYFLIRYFENTNKKYIICQEIDKFDFDRFVLKEKKCQELYLIGHGSKGSFRINTKTNQNDGIIDYSRYKGENKKRIIAQLHCANTVIGEDNKSLVDILAEDEDNSYVGHGVVPCLNIWLYCFNMWRKNRPNK